MCPPVALISERLWKSRFGADRSAVGRRLTVDGREVLIIGVLPGDFELPTLDRADLVMPQRLPVEVPASTAANSHAIRMPPALRPDPRSSHRLRVAEAGTPGIVVWRAVSPDYFRALGIPIVRGRPFTEDDRRPGEWSIILSASYVKFLFGDENPLGRRMCQLPGRSDHQTVWHTIVGVAGNARNTGLSDRNNAEYYVCRRAGETDAPPASAVKVLQSRSRG